MPRRSQQAKSGDKRAAEPRSKKAIPIDETTAEAITEQKRLFRVKFEREPGADDPLFFNPESAVPEFLGGEALEEIWRSLVQVAGESGLDPALVYAMNKTGRITPRIRLKKFILSLFRNGNIPNLCARCETRLKSRQHARVHFARAIR